MRTGENKEQSQGGTSAEMARTLQTEPVGGPETGIPLTPQLHGENEAQDLELEKPAGEKPKTTSIRRWRDSLTGLGDGGGGGEGWRAGVRTRTKDS